MRKITLFLLSLLFTMTTLQAQTIVDTDGNAINADDSYRLKHVLSGDKYLHLTAYEAAEKIQIKAEAYSADQFFKLEDAGEGKYYLKSESGYYITNNGAWNCVASQGYKTAYLIEEKEAGIYTLNSDKGYFGTNEGVNSEGAPIYTNQPNNKNSITWSFVKKPVVSIYTITYKYTYNGVSIGEEALPVVKDSDLPTPTAPFPYVITGTLPTGKVTQDAEYTVECNNYSLPFTITTDDNAPALYAIKSGRTDDSKEWYYTYDDDDTDAKIALTQFNGKETQYWYFKAAEHNNLLRIQIYPFAGEGKVMSYNNTNSEAGNVVAKNVGEENYTQLWDIVATDNKAPYGMKTNGGENYLSNNGGKDFKMGMWNAAPKDDSGTAMYFYSLSDMVTAKIADLKSTVDNLGTDVGQFSNAPENLVENVEEAENARTSDELIAAYKNLAQIDLSGLTVNMPIAEKIYTIKNYNGGKYMNVSDDTGATVYGDAALNELFQFVNDEAGNTYLYNVKRAKYLSNAPGQGGGQILFAADNISDAKTVKVAHLGVANQMSITPDGGATIHHDTNYSKVVGWNTGANDKSAWFIEEVTNPAEYVHGMVIGETGWATLCLGCDVTIPNGVEAYTVKEIDNSAVLEQVEGVIPAKCPVIIKAEAGEYSFAYSATKGVANETNLLVGATVNATEDAEVAYILGLENEEVALVKTETYTNNAFCAYLPKADNMTAEYYTLDIAVEPEDPTAIENVEITNEKEEIFDITGRKVNAITTRGIYIINGKKVIK